MNKKNVHIHPQYADITSFIEQIPKNFDQLGDLIKTGRNQVRIVEVHNQKYVIKYFKKVTLANRFIYAHFRKSKAQRSFENAERLTMLGISTPRGISYIDCYNKGMLSKSFFVSLYVEHPSLKEALQQNIAHKKELILAFSRFTESLHEKGVLHNDFHLDNVLYQKTDQQYVFHLIDNNRMSFTQARLKEKMKNILRIDLPFEMQALFIKEYARIGELDPYKIFGSYLFYRHLHAMRYKTKQFFKTLI